MTSNQNSALYPLTVFNVVRGQGVYMYIKEVMALCNMHECIWSVFQDVNKYWSQLQCCNSVCQLTARRKTVISDNSLLQLHPLKFCFEDFERQVFL